MRKIYFTLLLLFPLVSFASDPWSTSDKIRGGLFLGLSYVDYKQTIYIAEHPEEFSERNSFLGNHPSKNRVTNHFIIATGINLIFMDYLPSSYDIGGLNINPRATWQYLSIANELFHVVHNKKFGIDISF